jgi:uncharacterized DUF497 family protein
MQISYDEHKRELNLARHKLDMQLATVVFLSKTYDFADDRRDYGEQRTITIGHLDGRMVMVVWTPRSGTRRVISMRKCNDREQALYGPNF